MRVGLLDKNDNVIEGRYVDDCIPIEGDHIDKLVEWKTGYDAKDRAIKPTKMRIEMKTPASSPFSSKSTINCPAEPRTTLLVKPDDDRAGPFRFCGVVAGGWAMNGDVHSATIL